MVKPADNGFYCVQGVASSMYITCYTPNAPPGSAVTSCPDSFQPGANRQWFYRAQDPTGKQFFLQCRTGDMFLKHAAGMPHAQPAYSPMLFEIEESGQDDQYYIKSVLYGTYLSFIEKTFGGAGASLEPKKEEPRFLWRFWPTVA